MLATIVEEEEDDDVGSMPVTGDGPDIWPGGPDDIDTVTPCAPLCVPGDVALLEPALPPVASSD